MEELSSYLAGFGRRLRVRDGWTVAQRSLWMALVLSMCIQVLGRLLPVERLPIWSLIPVILWCFILLLFVLFKPLSQFRTALRVDIELGLQERLSTSIALRDLEGHFPEDLVRAQRDDALIVARAIKPNQEFPLHYHPKHWLVSSLLLIATLLLAFLPNPMNDILAQRKAVESAAEEQARAIEQLREEIHDAEELSPAEREELERQLSELAEALRANPGDLEQALADISRLEQDLSRRQDSKGAAKQANLEALASRLESLAGLEQESGEEPLSAAAQALQELAERAESLQEGERSQLAETLLQMAAQTAQAGDQQLAQAIASLAQALQSGDQQAAMQAAQDAQASMDAARMDQAGQAALQQALAQLQASRQALSDSGQIAAQGQRSGQGQNPGQGQGQNQGQAQGQGQPGGGGGSQANTLPPRTGQGRANAPQGSRPAGPVGSLEGQVYAPWQRASGSGGEMIIPGQDTGEGETQVIEGEGALPGADNPSLVPYSSVFYSYLNAANQAMENSYIPSAMLDYVRQYFTQLEP